MAPTKTTVASKKRGQYKCSTCGETGHTSPKKCKKRAANGEAEKVGQGRDSPPQIGREPDFKTQEPAPVNDIPIHHTNPSITLNSGAMLASSLPWPEVGDAPVEAEVVEPPRELNAEERQGAAVFAGFARFMAGRLTRIAIDEYGDTAGDVEVLKGVDLETAREKWLDISEAEALKVAQKYPEIVRWLGGKVPPEAVTAVNVVGGGWAMWAQKNGKLPKFGKKKTEAANENASGLDEQGAAPSSPEQKPDSPANADGLAASAADLTPEERKALGYGMV